MSASNGTSPMKHIGAREGNGFATKKRAPRSSILWPLPFISVLVASSAIPVVAAETDEVGFTPPASQEEIAEAQIPDAADVYKALAELEDEEKEREEWLTSPGAVEQRKDSLLAFADLPAGEAEQLLRAVLEPQLEILNGDPSRFLSDAQLVRDLPEAGALVREEGESSLLESPGRNFLERQGEDDTH